MGFVTWLRGEGWRPAAGFVVVDVETTGTDPATDRVVEIAIVRTDWRGRVIDEWTSLINPGGPVDASEIHGITDEDVSVAPKFDELVGEIVARLAGRAIVAHNARFDLAFLTNEFARAGVAWPGVVHLCTLEASRIYLPDAPRRRLVDCCAAYGITLVDAHAALGDTRATAELLAAYLVKGRRRHRVLPRRAARVRWPHVPASTVPARPRA